MEQVETSDEIDVARAPFGGRFFRTVGGGMAFRRGTPGRREGGQNEDPFKRSWAAE